MTIKLVTLIVLMGIALATSLAAWHARQASIDGYATLVAQADALLDAHRDALERAALTPDLAALASTAQALAAAQETAYVELTLQRAGAAPLVAGDAKALTDAHAHPHKGPWIRERVLLDRDGAAPGGRPQVLGMVRLVPDESALERAVSDNLRASLVRQAAVTLMVIVCLSILLQLLVSRPLQHMTRHIDALRLDSLAQPLDISRRWLGWFRDDFDHLNDGLNRMQSAISDGVEDLRQAREALERQHADLERTVAQRTAELTAANEKLGKLATRDGLTGLYNRRAFDERLEEELRRSHRSGSTLALLLADVDYFKRYNDTYGHPAGDKCLQVVAASMSESFARANDFVARYGGEEFAVIISQTSEDVVRRSVERMRERLVAENIEHSKSDVAPHVTLSIGVVLVGSELMPSLQDVIMVADQALYEAKRGGRNQARVHNSDMLAAVLTTDI